MIESDALVADWVGRTRRADDVVSDRLLDGLRATFPHLLADEPVPPGAFWCLAPDTVPMDRLGPDGHPQHGIFLPPVPYPRRMWAGGEVTFRAPLAPQDRVTRRTRIDDVRFKEGRTGRLCFVTVRHAYTVGETERIDERQDIVYREGGGAAVPSKAPPWPDAARLSVTATPTLLFRYSALTFNGHRIHYDAPYARDVEGYDGLVVHGPMQATLILNLAARELGRVPSSFAYRGLAPLICGQTFTVEVRRDGASMDGRVLDATGAATFSATITP